MSLEQEINEKSQEIATDAYGMSVGELVTLYRDGELDIHPEFQRFFRWSPYQKSRFIESLLLGIPIPSIFVSQTETGKWDVVDGLQRISTILELMGELTDQDGKLVTPLVLSGTKYLQSLEGKVWKKSASAKDELPQLAKLKIKRARFDIKIVLNTSDKKSKYELFQRLNTGGSIATDQEVRNCILIMVNRDFYKWLTTLKNDPNFKSCIPMSERQEEEQYNMELITRFVTLRDVDPDLLRGVNELGLYLTDKIVELAENADFDRDKTEKAFRKTFEILANALGEDCFKRYDLSKKRAVGPLLISMYEIVALGIGYHCLMPGYNKTASELNNIHILLWKNPTFTSGTGSGIRFSSRIPLTIPMGRNLYKP